MELFSIELSIALRFKRFAIDKAGYTVSWYRYLQSCLWATFGNWYSAKVHPALNSIMEISSGRKKVLSNLKQKY